jgi:hypothetical protein
MGVPHDRLHPCGQRPCSPIRGPWWSSFGDPRSWAGISGLMKSPSPARWSNHPSTIAASSIACRSRKRSRVRTVGYVQTRSIRGLRETTSSRPLPADGWRSPTYERSSNGPTTGTSRSIAPSQVRCCEWWRSHARPFERPASPRPRRRSSNSSARLPASPARSATGDPSRSSEMTLLLPFHLREQPEHNRPRRLVLLQVDQELPEGPCLLSAPELADPIGAVEVGESEDVDELGASRGGRASSRCRSACSISSKSMRARLMR